MLRNVVALLQQKASQSAVMTARLALNILGVRLNPADPSEVSTKAIKKAYIKKTLQCHPDLFPHDANATDKFRELADALRVALQVASQQSGAVPGRAAEAASSSTNQLNASDAMFALHTARQEHATHFHSYRLRAHRRGEKLPASRFEEIRADGVSGIPSSSLSEVTSMCRRETFAQARLRAFGEELPSTLCGQKCTLFEVFAFHAVRCAEPVSNLSLRLAKDLPIIVRRVVKQREFRIRKVTRPSMHGFASGEGSKEKKIEEMIMKPLVLVGALILADTQSIVRRWKLNGDVEQAASKVVESPTKEEDESEPVMASGRPQVRQGTDIFCCPELRCVLTNEDSIATIVKKLGAWEANSFDRLRVELAIGNGLNMLSSMLHLNDHGHPLAASHDLSVSMETIERISLTVQRLVCNLCLHADIAEDETSDGDAAGKLIEEIKALAEDAAPYIKGPIHVVPPSTPQDVAECLANSPQDVVVEEQADEAQPERVGHFNVIRHPSACDGATVMFSVSITASKHFMVFLRGLRASLSKVVEQGFLGSQQVATLLEMRTKVTTPEFIPINGDGDQEGSSTFKSLQAGDPQLCGGQQAENIQVVKEHVLVGLTQGGKPTIPPVTPLGDILQSNYDDFEKFMTGSDEKTTDLTPEELDRITEKHTAQHTQFRHAILCIARVFNMVTSDEHLFWSQLHNHRVYLSAHQKTVNALNVFYNCTPYDPTGVTGERFGAKGGKDLPPQGGWCCEDPSGSGDLVTLTERELHDSDLFRLWLEEIVEQSAIAKECASVMCEEGIGYIERDPTLPLCNFLSFLKLYVGRGGTAARAIIEGNAVTEDSMMNGSSQGGTARQKQQVSVETTGFCIVVGFVCDVREGGRLFIPWYFDPAQLVAMLQQEEERLMVNE